MLLGSVPGACHRHSLSIKCKHYKLANQQDVDNPDSWPMQSFLLQEGNNQASPSPYHLDYSKYQSILTL